MHTLKVIGITGFKQTGKTTFARHIKEYLTNNTDRVADIYSFAKPLKEICHILFGGNEDNWYGDLKTEILQPWFDVSLPVTPTPRKLMQFVGTELFRKHVSQEFWLHVARSYIGTMCKEGGVNVIIVDDVRFDNEAMFLQDVYGATIVRLIRADDNYKPDGDAHASERGINDRLVDYTCSFADYSNHKDFAESLVKRMNLVP